LQVPAGARREFVQPDQHVTSLVQDHLEDLGALLSQWRCVT